MSGIRVIDLSRVIAGPAATMMLSDMGADVIKVEPPGFGDLTRLAQFAKGGMTSSIANNNRGKRSIQIDLTNTAGKDLALRLMAGADVVVQNMRPGAVDRLGVGYEDVARLNPEIVYLSMSGYGPSGPYSDRAVYDPIIQAMSGYVATQVNPNVPIPDLVRNAVVDKASADMAALSVVSALLARERGAGGQHIELAMLDVAVQFLWPDAGMADTMLDPDVSVGHRLSDIYQLTPCADGHVVYFVISDEQFAGLYRALGRADLVDHPTWGNREGRTGRFEELGALLAEEFLKWNVAELAPRMHEHSVPCGEVITMDDLPHDPQIRHNNTFVEWTHPTGGRLRQPRLAPAFGGTPTEFRAGAPLLNEHADEILTEAGLKPAEIEQLRQAGAIT